MRSRSQILYALIILGSSLILGQCGRKSSSSGEGTVLQLGPYVPTDWNGEADWSGNALRIEELAP